MHILSLQPKIDWMIGHTVGAAVKWSAHPQKGQLLLCLTDLLDDTDEEHSESMFLEMKTEL